MNNVHNSLKQLRLNVGFIINSPIGYSRDFDFYFQEYADEDLIMSEVEGFASVGRTPQGLIVQGKFSGKTTLECVRCLTDYQQSLQWEFAELYAFTPENMTDSGLLVPDDAQLNLQTLVREFAILELPIKPVCKEDCQGLCMECGQNLNEKDCGHKPEVDSPFATLKDLLEKRKDVDNLS